MAALARMVLGIHAANRRSPGGAGLCYRHHTKLLFLTMFALPINCLLYTGAILTACCWGRGHLCGPAWAVRAASCSSSRCTREGVWAQHHSSVVEPSASADPTAASGWLV